MSIPPNNPPKKVPLSKAPAKTSPKTPSRPKKKKSVKKKYPYKFWIGVGALLVLGLVVLYVEFFAEKRKLVWPEGHSIYGVDVSHYQDKVNWQLVRENEISFAFVKATEGNTLVDKQFAHNWEGTSKVGILRGAYHFYLPYLDPEKQAANFISAVQLQRGDLPPVLDVEVRGRRPLKEFQADLKVWLQQVEEAYGVKPIIYTNYTFYRDYLAGEFSLYPLWIAHYKVKKLRLEKSDTLRLAFWQHTDGGAIKGIRGNVDCNVFYGSMRELKSFCVQ